MAEVAGQLRAVLDGIAQARAYAAAGRRAAIRARDQFASATDTGGHALVQQAMGQFTAAIDRLREADRVAAVAATAIVEYEQAVGIGLAAPAAPRPAPALPRVPGLVPPWIRKAARDLPERPGNQGPTRGQAFDSTGTPLSAKPWSSGRNIASTRDLRPIPGLAGFPWTLTDHVEARTAQEMRRPGTPRQVTLVLNNEPCTDDPYGCDRLLRHVIPAGSRLTVYVRDPHAAGGVRLFANYEGTGKGIAP